MKPATNIYQDGTYFRNNPSWDIEDSPWKARRIHSLVKKQSLPIKEIIEVGCGAGAILEELAQRMPEVNRLQGYDISPQAIELAEKRKNDRLSFIHGDFIAIPAGQKSDLLLVIDVVEHVEDYYGFLRALHSRSKYFIFHIPLDLSCRTLLKPHVLLQQRQAVGHLHYYSKEMVDWLLKDLHYKVIDWEYTKPVGDVAKAKNFRQAMKKTLRNFSFNLSPRLSDKLWGGYSMLILASNDND